MPAPPGLSPARAALAEDFGGWRRLAGDPPEARTVRGGDLDRLVELERGWPEAADGDRLLHLDLRAHNMLLRPDGTVVLVDWPWAASGAPVLDLVCLLPSVVLDGGGDPELLLRRSAVGRTADPSAVTCLVAALAGRMLDHARRPEPPGLPGLRAFQRAQGDAALAWLRQREAALRPAG